ncbi:MAG TPA: hypothetical protein VNL39_09275 [Xanthobacteraceae bacterium]|nr:hypothetical protein [Xanthobacteraceae bacterium]
MRRAKRHVVCDMLGMGRCLSRFDTGLAMQESENFEPGSTGRALVPLIAAPETLPPQAVVRQPACFIAHLIATKQALPQTRERCREAPAVAAAIYAATASAVPAPGRCEFARFF